MSVATLYAQSGDAGAASQVSQTAYLTASNADAAAQLEDSGARGIDGNQRDESAIEAGAVYQFRRTGTMWRQRAYVKGANTEAFDEFGSSVALSRDGRTIAVGARGEDSAAKGINGNPNDNSVGEAGAAYVFALGFETQTR